MGILSGNPKDEPLHYGEIYALWQCSSGAKLATSCYRTHLVHAGDDDLKKMLNEAIDQCGKEIEECDALLKANGIAPAPAMPEKPEAKLEDIPPGARLTDPEIAASLGIDFAGGLTMFSQAMAQSIREDVGALFAKYHATKTAMALKLLRLNKDKGWLVPPPLQVKRPEPVEV
ncbi:DUF3231 family protein [Paenibacillus flagellatus]|uniref:DUF3231 domain-containing protein n=1 Tax=Paenibacillus flagellatus TaxID=2211139 RepID=A0A2V5K338_9BACL|nr:DUF3231 family protein [Paenibacillus flagellatus]PYI53052.1 hypothetical protein DLM86_18815 [Paenibacillus flagellatus]